MDSIAMLRGCSH
jgi:hypothetical protein